MTEERETIRARVNARREVAGIDRLQDDEEPTEEELEEETYTVKVGDTLGSIATEQGTTVEALMAANPQITDPDVIAAGQVLVLPEADDEEPTAAV